MNCSHTPSNNPYFIMNQNFTFSVASLNVFELQRLCNGLEAKPSKVIKDLLKAQSLTDNEVVILSDYAKTFPNVCSAFYDQKGNPQFSPLPEGTLVVVGHPDFLYQGRYTKLTFIRHSEDAYTVEWKRGDQVRTLEIVKVQEDKYVSKADGSRAKLVKGSWAGYFTVSFPGCLVCSGYQLQSKDPQTVYKKFQPTLFSGAAYKRV